jgi:hypothetical protein
LWISVKKFTQGFVQVLKIGIFLWQKTVLKQIQFKFLIRLYQIIQSKWLIDGFADVFHALEKNH